MGYPSPFGKIKRKGPSGKRTVTRRRPLVRGGSASAYHFREGKALRSPDRPEEFTNPASEGEDEDPGQDGRFRRTGSFRPGCS